MLGLVHGFQLPCKYQFIETILKVAFHFNNEDEEYEDRDGEEVGRRGGGG